MRVKRILLIALLSVLPVLVFAAETHRIYFWHGFISASVFQSYTKDQRVCYVMGLWDGLKVAQMIVEDSNEHEKWFRNLMKAGGFSTYQLEAIVSKYLKDHPERWHKPFNVLCVWAFYDAWEKMQGQN